VDLSDAGSGDEGKGVLDLAEVRSPHILAHLKDKIAL
jgi:hypothetical protein